MVASKFDDGMFLPHKITLQMEKIFAYFDFFEYFQICFIALCLQGPQRYYPAPCFPPEPMLFHSNLVAVFSSTFQHYPV